MPTGLIRRGARYSIRRRIPLHLVPYYGGRKEVVRALNTADPKDARRRLPLEWAALTREFEEVEARIAAAGLPQDALPAPGLIPASGGADPWAGMSDDERAHEMDALAYREAEASRIELEREERAGIEAAVLATLHAPLDSLSPEQRALRDILKDRDFAREVAEEQAAIATWRLAEAERVPHSAPPLSTNAAPVGNGPGTSLGAIVDKWAAERKVSAKGVDTHRAVARWFVKRVDDLPVEAITKRHVIAFKDKLLEEGTTLPNVKVKLTRLRTLLNYAAANDIIPENPGKDVRVVLTDADRTKRRPFELADLTAIFSSPVYSADARPIQGRGEAAYWLPLLALFTGARLEELGQLRPSDVREEVYPDADEQERRAWFIHVTEDEEDGLKLKNAGSERVIPVHRTLEEQGFIRFVQAATEAGQSRLFPGLRPNIYGRLTAKWGEWFGAYLRNVVGITDRRLVFHSFRHTFKDKGRGRMSEGVQRQIMGHSGVDVADDYGTGFERWQLVEGMRSYKVPGFKMPPPPPTLRCACLKCGLRSSSEG